MRKGRDWLRALKRSSVSMPLIDYTIVGAHQKAAAKTYGPPYLQAAIFDGVKVCTKVSGMLAQGPPPRWRSTRRDPQRDAGLCGHSAPEVLAAPTNCQPIFLTPLATRRSSRRAGVRTGVCSSSDCLRQGFVASAVPQKRPNSAGQGRGKGDDSDVGIGARKQRAQPNAYCRISLRPCRHGKSLAHGSASCAGSDCRASLTHAASACALWLPARAPNPSKRPDRVPPECRGVAHSGDHCGGMRCADARNTPRSPYSPIGPDNVREFGVESGSASVTFVPTLTHITRREC